MRLLYIFPIQQERDFYKSLSLADDSVKASLSKPKTQVIPGRNKLAALRK